MPRVQDKNLKAKGRACYHKVRQGKSASYDHRIGPGSNAETREINLIVVAASALLEILTERLIARAST